MNYDVKKNSLLFFLHLVPAFVVIIGLNSLMGSPEPTLIQRNPKIQKKVQQKIEKEKPSVVLVGNSMLAKGVDEKTFSSLSKIKTTMIKRHGSASAWWYLALKNQILVSAHRPSLVVFFFRDYFLTRPSFRVTGKYKKPIDRIAGKNEVLLDRLAYLKEKNMLSLALSRYVSVYQKRDELRQNVDWDIKNNVTGFLLDIKDGEADKSIGRIFDEANMVEELVTVKQLEAEKARDAEFSDFDTQVDISFLPEMFRLAKQKGVRWGFVRIKRRRDVEPNQQPDALVEYIEELKAYLSRHNAFFWDFTPNSSIQKNHYAKGDHLNGRGRKLFTELLAREMGDTLATLR
ncbi:MAG: hypothetical protein GY847_33840 [Proteobacteria bacterium]|nr:hypothetical protein [Pseudomonadota bacterium]